MGNVIHTPYFGNRRIGIDKYIKKKLRILEDFCIITDDEDRALFEARYRDATEASDGDPYDAVDEAHYRILADELM